MLLLSRFAAIAGALLLLLLDGTVGAAGNATLTVRHAHGQQEGTAAAAQQEQPAPLQLRRIADAEALGAVCGDGSPAGYYIRHSTTGSPNWAVSVMGGGGESRTIVRKLA
jgi:Pectinacetylesterase